MKKKAAKKAAKKPMGMMMKKKAGKKAARSPWEVAVERWAWGIDPIPLLTTLHL